MELLRVRSQDRALALEMINNHLGLLGHKGEAFLKDRVLFFGLDGDVVVGLSGLRKVNSHLAEQVNTLILPRFRGRGFGRALSSAITRKAKALGFGKVYCTVNQSNQNMVAIKRAQGWQEEGLLRDHYAWGRTLHIFSTMLRE